METEPRRIRVLVADDAEETRSSILTLLSLEDDIEVVGEASDGGEALAKAKELLPDIVLMDMRMPVLDGVAATEALAAEAPSVQVIMISVMSSSESLRQAMMAGAREYLVKPFTPDHLIATIRNVHEVYAPLRESVVPAPVEQPPVAPPVVASQPMVIAVAGPKGGSGRTTVATNLAVALAQQTGAKVALVDACLRFGDAALSLNLRSERTIADLENVPLGDIDAHIVEAAMTTHASGVRVLLAPSRPEHGELVTQQALRKVVQEMRPLYQYVVVDLSASLHEADIAIMDLADTIIVLFTLEMAALKDVKLFLDLAMQLGYDGGKLMLVANRTGEPGSLRMEDVEEALRFKTAVCLPADAKVARSAMNKGVPFVTSHKDSTLSQAIRDLVDALVSSSNAEPSSGAGAGKRDKAKDKTTGLLRAAR